LKTAPITEPHLPENIPEFQAAQSSATAVTALRSAYIPAVAGSTAIRIIQTA
jgi:hypothetical protein